MKKMTPEVHARRLRATASFHDRIARVFAAHGQTENVAAAKRGAARRRRAPRPSALSRCGS